METKSVLTNERKKEILTKSFSIIMGDMSENLCNAITAWLTYEERTSIRERYNASFCYIGVQKEFNLLKFKPNKNLSDESWFPHDKSGQQKRVEILSELQSELISELISNNTK